jgi:hypothetical protein
LQNFFKRSPVYVASLQLFLDTLCTDMISLATRKEKQ